MHLWHIEAERWQHYGINLCFTLSLNTICMYHIVQFGGTTGYISHIGNPQET